MSGTWACDVVASFSGCCGPMLLRSAQHALDVKDHNGTSERTAYGLSLCARPAGLALARSSCEVSITPGGRLRQLREAAHVTARVIQREPPCIEPHRAATVHKP
jgi:hypothetical protein